MNTECILILYYNPLINTEWILYYEYNKIILLTIIYQQ